MERHFSSSLLPHFLLGHYELADDRPVVRLFGAISRLRTFGLGLLHGEIKPSYFISYIR